MGKNHDMMKLFIRQDKAHKFMKNIRGSPAYFQLTFYDLLGMIRQLGTPTWFVTLLSADMKWPDIIQIIGNSMDTILLNKKHVNGTSFDEKSN